MKRFAGHLPPVKKNAPAREFMKGVTDPDTGKKGLIFSINKITLVGPDQATVKGGYYEDGRSGSENTYSVKREEGKWVVVEDEVHGAA